VNRGESLFAAARPPGAVFVLFAVFVFGAKVAPFAHQHAEIMTNYQEKHKLFICYTALH
jgi:hypothetical protein